MVRPFYFKLAADSNASPNVDPTANANISATYLRAAEAEAAAAGSRTSCNRFSIADHTSTLPVVTYTKADQAKFTQTRNARYRAT